MEAYSVEDSGAGISFNIFVYNAQPQISIDYASGESSFAGSDDVVEERENTSKEPSDDEPETQETTELTIEESIIVVPEINESTINTEIIVDENADSKIVEDNSITYSYVLNTNTKKFHYLTCSSVDEIKEKNKDNYSGTRDELLNRGFSPCGRCKP